jgi:hypothetical protein
VKNRNFQKEISSEIYRFTGSSEEKQKTSTIWFFFSPKFEFVPLEIFQEFPGLSGLIIDGSTIPILKEDLFGSNEFGSIAYLYLCCNSIESIEPKAFQKFSNLKWIHLGRNKIEYLRENIFKANLKLEFINFFKNKIQVIKPDFFKNLVNLKILVLEGNGCVDKEIIGLDSIDHDLKQCYENWVDYSD